MPDDAATIAKEITLHILPTRLKIQNPERVGEAAGRVFRAVFQQVNWAIKQEKGGPAE
jgi:hypothetical protein